MNIHLALKNDLSEIERLAQSMTAFGAQHHLAIETVHDVNLALEEVVANIILYGYEDEREHQITVDIYVQKKSLTLEICDDARPFNPLENPDPDDLDKPLEEREIGGLGIYLTRTLMDELEYKREQGKNLLWMKKKLQ